MQLSHVACADLREWRRERRRENARHAQCARDATGVQRPVAAIGEDREILRLVAARAQFRGDSVGHVAVDGLLDQFADLHDRSEEHTSELQSLMRISYAVFCLKKNNNTYNKTKQHA